MTRTSFRFLSILLAATSLALGLSACGKSGKAIIGSREAPDEYAVYSRAPLSLPPDYNLRPPEPGTVRPQEADTRTQAKTALLSGSTAVHQGDASFESPGLQAFLRAAGAPNADPNIRKLVDTETRALIADQEKLAHKILFWQKPDEFGTAVDAKKEADRLKANRDAGKPVNDGEVPVIERKEKGLFR